MRDLKIADLSFCETEVPEIAQVQGGNKYGGYVAVYDTDKSAGYYVNKKTKQVSAYYTAAIGVAVAAYISDTGNGSASGGVVVGA